MHRKFLLSLLDRYLVMHPEERACVSKVRTLVETHPDCFDRTCVPGHITGSAWVVSADRQRTLLTYHRKLGRWLQLGGHADGETEPHRVALREAREESGLTEFCFVEPAGHLLPFDIDVHLIPPSAHEPAHEHHDRRYLLIASSDQPLRMSDESNDLRWFTQAELLTTTTEASILRMLRKAQRLY